ncbi:MAG: hypothetical protein GX254_10320 [Clostridiales bacterium]|jgi:predicted transcriptional regulator|nr:hypothetical protein [Clostridiales bacterium]
MEAVLGIEYYAFAFYVFILVCIIILICRAAFSQYKKQKMFFDEKEAKLLKLYQTVEDAMDEFFDMAAESKSEMDEALKKLSSIAGVVYKNSSRLRLSEEIPERNEMAPETVKDLNRGDMEWTYQRSERFPHRETPSESTSDLSGNSSTALRNETILRLFRCGKTRAQIAQELNITQNEVDLVIGMHKNLI